MVTTLRTWSALLVGLLVIVSACTSGDNEQAKTGELATSRFEPQGQFELLHTEPFDADRGVLIDTSTGMYTYYLDGSTICRLWLAQSSETCITDARFKGQPIDARLATGSKLIMQAGFFHPNNVPDLGDGIVVNFDTKSIEPLTPGPGFVGSISADGDQLLWTDLYEATASTSRLDGSSVKTFGEEALAAGGVWASDGTIWLHGGLDQAIYDPNTGEIRTIPGEPMLWIGAEPELQAGLGWTYESLADMTFGEGSVVFVDLSTETTIPLPAPADSWPLAFGIAPDGRHVVALWEQGADEPTTELHLIQIDRESGSAGAATLIHTFEPALDMPFDPRPAHISVDDNGTLTWFTRTGVMTAKLGAIDD